MCDKFPNIKVVEGNAFRVVIPLKRLTFESCQPIEEDIDATQLTDVVLLYGGVQVTASLGVDGVSFISPATQPRGTYDIILTAKYQGTDMRAAYEGAITIVPWNSQSNAQQFVLGSPIVLKAAYLIGGALTDAELEALKEEYRERNAELAQAIADAEAAKREWEEKAADLDGVAKEATSQEIKTAVENINIDTTTLAKQGTNPNATLTEVQAKIGTPASGQGADLFAAMRDIALSATTLQELADAWSAMVTNRQDITGFEFISSFNVQGVGDIIFNSRRLLKVHDTTTVELGGYGTITFGTIFSNVEIFQMDALVSAANTYQWFRNSSLLRELILPSLQGLPSGATYAFASCPNLRKVYLPSFITNFPGNDFAGDNNLIDITLGAYTTSFGISSWSPTNALDANSQTLLTPEDIAAGFTSNLEKLLYNIREHIAANLPVAPNTITFSAAVKAAILADQPTADAFTNKNWTIA